VPVDDLREWHLGACEGLTNAEVDALYPGLRDHGRDLQDMAFCWPGGESRGAFCARVRRAFAEILGQHAGGAVAVVSHVAVLSTCLAEAVDGAPWHWPKYLLDNGALSELMVDETGGRLLRHNVGVPASPPVVEP
jgi:broad specificity phosphatase PhoE